MNLKKNKKPKLRYILIHSLLKLAKINKYLNRLVSYKLNTAKISQTNFCILKVEPEYYILKIKTEYVALIRMLVNYLPVTKSIKTMHTIYKYKQSRLL